VPVATFQPSTVHFGLVRELPEGYLTELAGFSYGAVTNSATISFI
jgi:hypothetical protein